ncbi:uncharacterized protein LOC116170183 [Photinus pyralis]|uniref:uncharacterized protein LOC116170183 n=1 Tax=Photinus pyralis TaxID=7054 RepID=UPI001266EC96|nr:uncharacterized protein LOC116170183 [Photinus pyralis]
MPTDTRSNIDEDAVVEKVVSKVVTSQSFIALLSTQIRACIAEEFQNQIKVFSEKVVRLENDLSQTESELSKVKIELAETKEALRVYKDETEQYSRRNSLRFFGVPEINKEDVPTVIATLCSERMHLNITTDMIDIAHRLPGKEGKNRPIIVKFISRHAKNLIFRSKKQLKGSSIVIREDLTKARQQLLKECATRYGSKCVWTSDCKIFVKRGPNDIKRINNLSDLNHT